MAARYQFVMRSGPTPGAMYALESDAVTIGRDSSNTIQINDAEISRRHARLIFQGGKYVIEDSGSTNGTHVNGQRIAGPVVLKPGDVVSFGEQIVLAYEAGDFDPGATLASPRSAARSSHQASVPPPPMAAPVAGQVPASPMTAPKKSNILPIVVSVGIVLFICACVLFGFWIDADPTGQRWCTFLPFLKWFGYQCP
jgi:predicted component of type VI protein secretion system